MIDLDALDRYARSCLAEGFNDFGVLDGLKLTAIVAELRAARAEVERLNVALTTCEAMFARQRDVATKLSADNEQLRFNMAAYRRMAGIADEAQS